MGLQAIKGQPAGDKNVILGPSDEKVNASFDKNRC